jgi:hypothetical protein
MSDKHFIKLTKSSAVVKLYSKIQAGSTITISLGTELKLPDETFDLANAQVSITQMYWANKSGKHCIVQRKAVDNSLHGDYFLPASGHFKFEGFRDRTYGNYDFNVVFDGEGTLILVLSKESGFN